MNYFSDMQKQLRTILLDQIENRALSVSELSQQTQFSRSHISNFLRKKVGFTMQGADRILAALGLSAEDLLTDSRAPSDFHSFDPKSWAIPVISHTAAICQPVINPGSAASALHLPLRMLEEESNHCLAARRGWTRFVAVQASSADSAAMNPILHSDAIVVIDRHNTSPPRKQEDRPPIFAISSGTHLVLRYVIPNGDQLILRPSNLGSRLDLIQVEPNVPLTKLLVGRIVYVLNPQ
jgi:AraC-like DNA-binding protein